jgi:LIVCS family branched-chain amino acid:cation transporter
MKNILKSTVLAAGLAIFSMFFGAGNLMFPIQVGVASGDNFLFGIAGFLLTAVLLPVLGLVAIVLFNGDYNKFFGRLGRIPGIAMVAFCMAVIGPFIAMSRIVTLSYTMLSPFFPIHLSLLMFSILFCGLTFLATYRESKIIDLLGNLISPALLMSLGVILIKGILSPKAFLPADVSPTQTFIDQAVLGYAHLDILGGIFFGSIVLMLLKRNIKDYDTNSLAWTSMKAGFIGAFLLGLVYTGMALLGAFYGTAITNVNLAELFSVISFQILGKNGAFVIATAVAMACFSTIIALATVLAEYVHKEVTSTNVSYASSLITILGLTTFLSCYGLENIMTYSGPIINTFYPLIIILTFLNIAYKLFKFKPVKTPMLIGLIVAVYLNYPSYSIYLSLFS